VSAIALLVIAKEPIAGRAKTRLCPPCTPEQASALAGAALRDTLDTVARTPAARRVLVFEGDAAGWVPDGFECIAQRGGGLAERLAAAFEDVGRPALLVGMDTPQLTPELLRDGLDALARSEVDAVLGPATDGGYWSIGLSDPARAAQVFSGIPMSAATTCALQRQRLLALGLRIHEQAPLTDVDTFADARAVAAASPATLFARTLAAVPPIGLAA
jgi:rSAM/selenodomain-associated transferase 1